MSAEGSDGGSARFVIDRAAVDRTTLLERVRSHAGAFDVVVVGGGATGLGCMVDAAARGYSTVLLERDDFAKGTSSRSTKLVHGGVRYLKQGNVGLVLEALKERGILRGNAPHLVSNRPFVVPVFEWWESPFYGIGLKMYDLLAGRYGFGKSQRLSKEETVERIPTVETEGLRGGIVYHDGQFDDARLASHLALTGFEQGAVPLNYAEVVGLIKREGGLVSGVRVRDCETDTVFDVDARVVINATGVFADGVRRMDEPDAAARIRPSRGVHLVLDRSFLPGDTAIMVPQTDDGRVLFAIPWHDRVVVGTTDTSVDEVVAEPCASEDEVDFILRNAARYLAKDPVRADVLSVFAGLRPLVAAKTEADTAELSRDHSLLVSRSGLVTITGGKWTTYRKMAEDTIEQAAMVGELEPRPCVTAELRLHGYEENAERFGALAVYGADAPAIEALIQREPALGEQLHPALPQRAAEVVWSARFELARTVEDVLSRRTRALLLDARAAEEAAPRVAELLAAELGKDAEWVARQVKEFTELARGYQVRV